MHVQLDADLAHLDGVYGLAAQKVFVLQFSVRNAAMFPMLDTISFPPKTQPDGGLRCFVLQLIYN
jgi:hypothetical protein